MPKSNLRCSPARPFRTVVLFFPLLLPATARAQSTLYWNPPGGLGGDGIWGTGPADDNWKVAPNFPGPSYPWPTTGENIARFSTMDGGTVTVFGSVKAAGIVLSGRDYSIEGGTISLIAGAAPPKFEIQYGILSVGSAVAGSAGFEKTGLGMLALSGLNTITGPVLVSGGTLQLAASGQLADSSLLTLSQGTTLSLEGGTETVGNLISNGAIISGSGKLVATEYQLNGGTSLTGHLGAGILSSAGLVSISGTSDAQTVHVNAGASLILSGGNLSGTAALNLSEGSRVILNGDQTVNQMQSAGGTLAGPGRLVANAYFLYTRTTVSADLGDGVIVSNGEVAISGKTGKGQLLVRTGKLTLTGASGATDVQIDPGAVLQDGGNLSDKAAVFSRGELAMDSDDRIRSFVGRGTIVSGSGVLTAATYFLEGAATVSGRLGAGQLTISGRTAVSGTVSADVIYLQSGVLTNTGTIGNAGTHIELFAGTRLEADGVQNFSKLTTFGEGVATYRGNLDNSAGILPGGKGGQGHLGILRIDGRFSNLSGGTLAIDAGRSGSDLLVVTGAAELGGTLSIRQTRSAPITAFSPVQIIDAASYSGNFATLTENLEGSVFFNPTDGTITRFGSRDTVFTGSTANQAATWAALYEDVIDPDSKNVTRISRKPPAYSVTGGLASADHPELLDALTLSAGPGGLNGPLLDRLSPAVYTGLSDFAVQAVRAHIRAALDAPALATAEPQIQEKGAKAALVAPPQAIPWELFAAADYFNGGSTEEGHGADYGMSGSGFVAGGRVSIDRMFRLGAFVSADEGSVNGPLLDADTHGASVGIFGEALLPGKYGVRLTTGLTYGRRSYDGSRESVAATAGGWSPRDVKFSGVDAEALDVFAGVEAVALRAGNFRLIPSVVLRYTSSSVDSFRERTSGPIALAVDESGIDSLVSEFSLAGEMDVNSSLVLDGQLGANFGLLDDSERVSARFANGATRFSADTRPLSDDLFFLGIGATWSASESVRLRLGYRAEFRADADPLGEVSFSTTARF